MLLRVGWTDQKHWHELGAGETGRILSSTKIPSRFTGKWKFPIPERGVKAAGSQHKGCGAARSARSRP